MKKIINFSVNVLFIITLFISLLSTFFTLRENELGFLEYGNSTFLLDNKTLIEIRKKDSIKIGDNVFYYVQSSSGFKLINDKLVYKNTSTSGNIYVFENRPDEVISETRIAGSVYAKHHKLGALYYYLIVEKKYKIFVLILLFLTIYKIYSLISLKELNIKMPLDIVELPKLSKGMELPKLKMVSPIKTKNSQPSTQSPIAKRLKERSVY